MQHFVVSELILRETQNIITLHTNEPALSYDENISISMLLIGAKCNW